MITLLPRILLMILGWFICPVAIATAKNGKFRQCFYWFDNEEDGYWGDKLGWYSNYLGRDLNVWDHYIWCAWRNPVFNLRYVPWFSCDTEQASQIRFEGNTYNKRYEWSLDKERKHIWFNFSCMAEGKRRKMKFHLIPITKKYSLKFIMGWKFYPRHYLEPVWIKRIAEEGFPQYKDRAIYTLGLSLKKM